ncbi:alpha/beta hydrolase [Bacteroides mediterraneensis]|uniref:alpha/beta hydrolase n=1 Tax=Bacteroides mediterraneensis TaxID=1841856 RepID=UPI00093251A2|nr:alpha/beta fold hydrolase [Bacteroides mediterraneensis]
MKKILPFFIGSLFLVSTLHAQQTNLQRAATILQWMKDTQCDSIYACFDAKMQQAISSSQLKDMWTQVEQQLGPLEKEKEWKQDAIDGTVVYYTDLKFQRAPLRLLVTFNADNKVSGLRLLSVPPEEKPLVAPFDSVHLEESPIEVVSGNYKLPGTLTRPKGKTHLPIIILVHGSGPQDRDGSIGPNKIYRDIAWGLAAQGIAVLRYDKRTYVYGKASVPEGKEITPDEEVVEDAVSACQLAASLPFIDKRKVFIAGHSLGGLLAPLIATRCPSVTGLILLAAPSRPQDDILKEQIRYLGSLNGNTDEKLLAQQYQQIKAAAPQIYWDYLDKYAPVMTACSLSVPMLFLQGERDYQVTMQDFAMWKLGMFGKTNATFQSYPTLNHCFMEGTGKSTPMEYNHPARVYGKVMEDIAKWVTQE